MQINNLRDTGYQGVVPEKAQSSSAVFADTLINKLSGLKDTYTSTEETDSASYMTYNHSGNISGNLQTVETERYVVSGKEGGYLRIYDKEEQVGFNWKLGENEIQVDPETGLKFLINDLGAGFFNMVTLDTDLENAVKESLGVDELEEKELENFTVHQDRQTGIYYITADGYESRGGQLVLDDAAKQKLDVLAQEYMEQYPEIIKTKEEAWFYATFEVRGMAKRTDGGIWMIGPNSLSFKDKTGENDWTGVFVVSDWEKVKDYYENSVGNVVDLGLLFTLMKEVHTDVNKYQQ